MAISLNSRKMTTLAGASLAALAFASTSAAAQTAPATPPAQTEAATGQDNSAADPAEGAIIVTGLRASIQTARDLKRDSDVVVDSVSAQDIGALPDRSVTEAIQRIPGVSVTRFAAGNNPDRFSVEGSGVVVRGLTYTRSQLNGRDTFTANNGRGLSFADVPAELLAGVDVYKSPSADMIEGGISGTVNLRTRTPFDAKGLLLAATVEQNYSDFANKSSPNISVLASDRMRTSFGEIGAMVSFVRSELNSRADGIQIANFGLRGLDSSGNLVPASTAGARQVYVPRGGGQRTQEYNRVRYGYAGALQWRSLDGRATATFQFLRSDARERSDEHTMEIATDNVTSAGDSRPVPGTNLTFDDNGVFTSGTLTAPIGYRDDQYNSRARVPLTGMKSSNTARYVDRHLITDDFGANFKFAVNDRLALAADYQHVRSRVDVYDLSVRTVTYQNTYIKLNGSDLPDLQFVPIQACVNAAACPGVNFRPSYFLSPNNSFLSPYNTYYGAAMDHVENSTGDEDAARIDLTYSFPSGFLKSIETGYRWANRKNTARFSTYNYGVLSDIYAGAGPVWLDDPVNGIPDNVGTNPARLGGPVGPQSPYYFSNFLRGRAPSAAGPGRLYFPIDQLRNYAAASQSLLQIGDEWRPRLLNGCPQNWVPLSQRCGVIPGTDYLPSEINPVEETVNAAYIETRFGTEFGNGWKLTGNAGVRYTSTVREASGYYAFPSRVYTCAQPTSPFCNFVPDANQFANGAMTPITARLHYDYFLPAFNAKLNVGGGLLFRAAYNKGISLPEFGLTRAFYNVVLNTGDQAIVTNGAPVAIFNVGNPYLKPVEANNYDLTAEYYFSKVGQVSVALFAKDLKGVVTNGTERLTFTNNGVSFDGIVTTPFNSPDTGRVRGFEVGYSQTYDFLPGILGGLGLTANYTYVRASGVRQSTLNGTDPDVAAGTVATVDTSKLPLQGLSKHTFNIQPFYQRGQLELRAAYSWRSRFLLTTRDVIVPFAPIISEATGQLDASVFVNVTPRLRLGIQGYNLTAETARTSQVINSNLVTAPRSWFVADRRVTLSVRARLGN
jgi:TonB-dependent receptor